MLETMEKLGCTSVADFGAGVSPIPFLLSENGMKVFTVDLSDSIVEVKPGSKLS